MDSDTGIRPLRVLVMLILGSIIWLIPPPEGLTQQAWYLFAIFFTTIVAIIAKALPLFAAAVIALAIAIISNVLTPAEAYSGFSKDFIVLIIAAFLVSRGVINSGLGSRLAFIIIRRMGKSTLGLSYSMAVTDAIIAPAFPSNTARSGVLYPIIKSIAVGSGSTPEDGTIKKTGNFLMMSGIAGLTISSALWLTAMAANPVGAEIAGTYGVNITFFSWFVAASVPSIVALIVVPYVLFRVVNPEIKETPDAPEAAAKELDAMGKMSKQEWITAVTFICMVAAWAGASFLKVDKAAIAFLGLGVLMVANIYTLDDLKKEGETLSVWIWFGVLYTLSSFLNEFGFMTYIGDIIATWVVDFPVWAVYLILVLAYVLIHYLFVSQTAQMLALYGVFLVVGIEAGVNAALMAYILLFATNWFAAITPQGSSANVLFAGSGYLKTGELYRYGAVITAVNTVIYLAVGTPWILLIT